MDELENEEWRPTRWDSSIEVSNLGRVRSKYTKEVILLKAGKYPYVGLNVPGKGRLMVHQLVADTFLGACPEGLEVDHIDCNPENNQVTNLRYVTHSENMRNRRGVGRDVKYLGAQVKSKFFTEAKIAFAKHGVTMHDAIVVSLALMFDLSVEGEDISPRAMALLTAKRREYNNATISVQDSSGADETQLRQ